MPPKPPPQALRRHRLTAFLLALYLPLIILPWVVLCVLDVKPMTRAGSSYVDRKAEYAPSVIHAVDAWMRAAKVLNTAAAILAIPVVSAILGHAAVAMVQRRSPEQPLDLGRLLRLSDGVGVRLPNSPRDGLLTRAGFALVVLSVLIPLLQSALVIPKSIRVATCRDSILNDASCDGTWRTDYVYIGYDPEPAALDIVPLDLVLQGISSRLTTVSGYSPLMYGWDVYPDEEDEHRGLPGTINKYYLSGYGSAQTTTPYFVSAMPAGTNTGVLRQHALRLNTTHSCETINPSTYPTKCPGSKPFTGSFSNEYVEIRFCAPGDYEHVLWTMSRNRLDRSELFFIDFTVPADGEISEFGNFTVRCEAKTTRGYFELPNYYNNNTAGPLLEEWPSEEDLEANFDDALYYYGRGYGAPSELDPLEQYGGIQWPYIPDPTRADVLAPGPLMTSLLAMLGDNTFFSTAVNATVTGAYGDALVEICNDTNPLTALDNYGSSYGPRYSCEYLTTTLTQSDPYIEKQLSRIVMAWFHTFNTSGISAGLGSALYYAHEQLLTTVSAATQDRGSRPILTAEGTTATKPSVPLAVKIFISVLLAAQVAALVALAVYIYSAKTFGHALDAMAFLAIGATAATRGGRGPLAANEVPRLGLVREVDLKKLEAVDGTAALRLAIGHRDVGEDLELSSRASTTVEPPAYSRNADA